jgi:hypothetical protein
MLQTSWSSRLPRERERAATCAVGWGRPFGVRGRARRSQRRGRGVLTETFSVQWPDAPHRVLRSCVEAAQALKGDTTGEVNYGEVPVPRFASQLPNRTTTGEVRTMANTNFREFPLCEVRAITPRPRTLVVDGSARCVVCCLCQQIMRKGGKSHTSALAPAYRARTRRTAPEEQTVMRLVKRAKLFVFLREHRHQIFGEGLLVL